MTRIYAYAATLLLILAGVWYYGHTRYEAGKSSQQAAIAKAQADAADYEKARDILAQQIGDESRATLDKALPKIEATTHDSVQKVRVIYHDHSVTCVRPDGVRNELEKARDRANAAAG